MKDIAYKRISETKIKLATLICEQLKGSYKNEFKGKLISILAKTGIGNVYNLIYDYATKHPENCDSLIALSKYDRPESFDYFKEKLQDPRTLHRDLIVECLGNYNKPELVSYLKTFLADEDRQVRFQAIYALYNIGGKEAALAMCDYISDPDEWISMTILRLLCKMKVLETIPILTEKYYSDTDLRRKALMISFLSRFRSITLLEAFDDALQARDARLRANAIEAIGDLKLPEEELSKRIVPFLNDPNNRIRANAILAMAKITPEKVRAQIIEMCNSDDIQLRRSAAFILCMIPPNEFFSEAEKLIVDENDTVRKRMIQSLKNFPHQFISSNINKVLSDENKWIRKYAIDMVASIPAFEATPIVNILKSEQAAPNIEACLNFLVSHPSDNAMNSLRIHFKDKRLPVVKSLLKALLAIGGVEEVKKMAPKLEQRDPYVVQNITSTMLESGSLETLNEFIERFQKVKTNNNMELILPALESVIETISKGEKMPPKLLKAFSEEPVIQNMGYGYPMGQQPQMPQMQQQYMAPQPTPYPQTIQPNMGIQPQVPQYPNTNQFPQNFGMPQQPVQNFQNFQQNINIQQPIPQTTPTNQNATINFDTPQVGAEQPIPQTDQNTAISFDIPQIDAEQPIPQTDQNTAISFDIPQIAVEQPITQTDQNAAINFDIPQIDAEQPIPQTDQNAAINFDNTQNIEQSEQSQQTVQTNQNNYIAQDPTQQQDLQATEQDSQQNQNIIQQPMGPEQLFQELPPLENSNSNTITAYPSNSTNFDISGFNLNMPADTQSPTDVIPSMALPSFNELNIPNAPEIPIATKPHYPHYKAGLKAYNLGKYPKSIDEFNKSIANNENPPKTIDMYLGIMFFEQNEYESAIKHLNAFVKNVPNNAKANYLLGKCYRKTKDWQKVIDVYQLFIEGKLDASPKMKKRIYQDMGTACAILGKSETAVRLLSTLYKLETENAEIGYYLAMALYKMKKSSEASVIIEKAIKTAPKGKPLEKLINSLSQTIRSGGPLTE